MEAKNSKKSVIRRLESIKIVRPLVNEMYSEGVIAAQQGRPVAWCMVNWWEGDLVMRAMGITPVYPENYGTVCASTGAAQKYQAICDAEGFPNHLCGYARNCIGYTAEMKRLGKIPPDAPLGGMAEPNFMLGSGIGCDTRFKWFQALRKYWDVPVWTIDTPWYDPMEEIHEDVHNANINYMVKELQAFIAFLEDRFSRKLDLDLLEQYLDNQEKVFKIWWEVNELRKTRPSPLHARDFWTLMVPAYYLSWKPETIALYNSVHEEVKARVAGGIGAIPEEKYRVMFADLPPWHSLGFFDALAERGWNFVIESVAYHTPEPLEEKRTDSVLARLAQWTYHYVVGHTVKAKKLKNLLFGDVSTQAYFNWAMEYEADGLLTHSLLSCRAATFWHQFTANVLKEQLLIPSMSFEGDIVDLSVFDPANVLKNAATFENAMDHYRNLRNAKNG